KAERDLDRFLRLARRHHHQVSLALFRLDRFEGIAERHGHGAADLAVRWFAHLLQQSFRAEDIISRWNNDDFVVALFDAGSDDAVARAREVIAAVRDQHFVASNGEKFSLTCSAGVATFPDDASDPASLYASADAALVSARVTMPDEALGIASAPHLRAHGRVDVVLIEDDPAVAALVIHALESRQYAVRWLRDGHEAAAALLGESPELRARLVLLEVNLPAFDGLSILRALSAQGKLQQTRAIMLSVRSSEAEVVQAFEMGAFDHVAKPFSVSILVERIRRALSA
ncbi:MAG: diguanylate cyclase, partial [Gemmatimonadaceae bacterium]